MEGTCAGPDIELAKRSKRRISRRWMRSICASVMSGCPVMEVEGHDRAGQAGSSSAALDVAAPADRIDVQRKVVVAVVVVGSGLVAVSAAMAADRGENSCAHGRSDGTYCHALLRLTGQLGAAYAVKADGALALVFAYQPERVGRVPATTTVAVLHETRPDPLAGDARGVHLRGLCTCSQFADAIANRLHGPKRGVLDLAVADTLQVISGELRDP